MRVPKIILIEDRFWVSNCDQLRALTLSELKGLDFRPIASLNRLEELFIVRCDTLEKLDFLKDCTNIINLILVPPTQARLSLAPLASLKQLNFLSVGNAVSTAPLKDLSNLERLSLQNPQNLDFESGFETLQTLILFNCSVDSKAAEDIIDLPAIQDFSFSQTQFSDDAAGPLEAAFPELQMLFQAVRSGISSSTISKPLSDAK